MKKGIFWTIIIVIIGLVVWRVVQHEVLKGRKQVEVSVQTDVVVEKATRDVITDEMSYAGNIVGIEQVNVYPMEETGRLIRYLVKEGDKVSKGRVIAIVDRSIKGLNYKPAQISVPISGIVGILFLDKGAMVAPQIPLAMIANIDRVKVEIQISEVELRIIKEGQNARVRVDFYPENTFSGIITEITPVVNPLSRTAKGEIVIDNPEHLLKPGMLARVRLIVAKHRDVIVVPEKAVLVRNDREIVFTKRGDIAKKKDVKTGIKNNDMIEVVEGLNDGEEVIVSGNYGLRDGAKIRVKKNNRLGGQQ